MKAKSIFILLLLLGLLSGCAPRTVSYTVVAQGDPAEGPTIDQPRFLAFISGQSYETFVADLPGEAASALATALKEGEQGLYILVYAGAQPTAGYSVEVRRVTSASSGGKVSYTVQWSLKKPTGMAAQVITHPWILVYLPGSFQEVPAVKFSELAP